MNSNFSTTISYYDLNGQRILDEDYNAGKIYPFKQGRKDKWASPADETELYVYYKDESGFLLWDKDHRNLQTQLERREELFKEVAKLEKAGADLSLYFQIASYEQEIIPTEEFLALAEKVEKVKDLEEWAESVVRRNQKDEDLGEVIIASLDYGKLIEKLLDELNLTANEVHDGWLLYPKR